MTSTDRRSRRWPTALAAVLVVGGGGAVAVGTQAGADGPDQPALVASADAGVPTNPSGPTGAPPAPSASSSAPAERAAVAAPSTVSIPAIGVSSRVIALGLAEDGSIAVPQPGPDYDLAAWFSGSPRPGADGPSVIEGHVDSEEDGPSVFSRLGELEPGDAISVARRDGSTADFEVTGSQRYAKDDFPTLAVYGNTDGPELRLITCGGSFDAATGHYRDNTVVFARAV